jgi:hypothetical protein
MFISGVNDTGDKRGKFLGANFFHFLLRAYLSALFCCRLNFCFIFIFRSRQAGIVSTVLSAKKCIDGVIDTAKQFFGGRVDTGDKF